MSISRSPPFFVFGDLWIYSVLDQSSPSQRDKNCFETRLKHEKTFWIYLCCNLKLFYQWWWKKNLRQNRCPKLFFFKHQICPSRSDKNSTDRPKIKFFETQGKRMVQGHLCMFGWYESIFSLLNSRFLLNKAIVSCPKFISFEGQAVGQLSYRNI